CRIRLSFQDPNLRRTNMSKKKVAILEKQTTQRKVIKKAAYIAPVILTMAAVPSFAAKGSKDQKTRARKNPRKGHSFSPRTLSSQYRSDSRERAGTPFFTGCRFAAS